MGDSDAIDTAVEKALAEGNEISEISTGWTKVRKVIHMKRPLSDNLRLCLAADSRLRAWQTDPTPHNRPEEGFADDEKRVAMSFPRIVD